jgi:hypothetical protein
LVNGHYAPMIARRKEVFGQLLSRKLPLSQAAEAHAAAEKGGIGKILLVA